MAYQFLQRDYRAGLRCLRAFATTVVGVSDYATRLCRFAEMVVKSKTVFQGPIKYERATWRCRGGSPPRMSKAHVVQCRNRTNVLPNSCLEQAERISPDETYSMWKMPWYLRLVVQWWSASRCNTSIRLGRLVALVPETRTHSQSAITLRCWWSDGQNPLRWSLVSESQGYMVFKTPTYREEGFCVLAFFWKDSGGLGVPRRYWLSEIFSLSIVRRDSNPVGFRAHEPREGSCRKVFTIT